MFFLNHPFADYRDSQLDFVLTEIIFKIILVIQGI
jgi:hypothetical protein